jgi:ribose transport system permease protein
MMSSIRLAATGLGAPLASSEIPKVFRRSGIVVPFVALFVALTIASGTFATKGNLLNLLDQQSAVLITAAAGTLVFIAGGLDLSVGAVYALAAVVAGKVVQHEPVLIALLAGLGVGVLVGLINGFIAAVLEVNSLIATLAMSFVVTGVASLVTAGNAVTMYSRPGYGDLAQTQILTVASSTCMALLVVVVLALALWRTVLGRYIYAVGGNASAARLAGVRVTAVRVLTFVLSGAAAALGGLVDSSRVLSANSSNGGDALTFTVIAGIVVGGTSIRGGEGAVWRSFLGVLFLALVANGYNLLGLNPLYQQITLGALILLAVGSEPAARAVKRWRSLRHKPALDTPVSSAVQAPTGMAADGTRSDLDVTSV